MSADTDLVGRCLKDYSTDAKSHTVFAKKADEHYRAYRAILDKRMDAATWTTKSHPPYVFQIIEVLIAGLVDPNPRWKLNAIPRSAQDADVQQMREGIKANELLLAYQAKCDKLVEKQRPLYLQAAITGLSVAKTYWLSREEERHRQVTEMVTVTDDDGNVIGQVPTLGHAPVTVQVNDEPTMEVVDVRDFIWHEAATSLDTAKRVTHRIWKTIDELREMAQAGRFNKASLEDIEKLKDTRGYADALPSREQDLFKARRTKDMIEVLECWVDHGKRRVTIANKTLLLDDRPNPFWHGQYPFVTCSGTPDLFRIPGISDVGLINEIQEMIWTLANQRLDAVQLLNNPVVMFRSDFDDPESFDFYPGARNVVDDPSQVTLWTPPILENRSIQHEEMLKADLEAIPGASPALLGQQLDTTATAASLSSTLAQRRISSKKMQFQLALARVAEQWIMLNQQFITEDKVVPILGRDDTQDFFTIEPMVIQGDYKISVEELDKSLIRQERTAEASARLQIALSAAPVFAGLAQSGAAPMLNMEAFAKDWLDSYEITDTDRYFTNAKPQLQQQPAQQQGAPAAQQLPDGGMPDVSAPQATDQNSPSNGFSQSPVAALQRQGALAGGPANNG